MTKLSVNINKIATIRNARGGNIPNIVKAARDIEAFGADGITVHPRPDERHITKKDVFDLASVVSTEFNIEGYPDKRFMDLVKEIRPAQATLVPDSPDVITSNAGWNTKEKCAYLQDIIGQLKEWGIRTSIFVDTNKTNIEYAQKTNVDRIELYTGPFAKHFLVKKEKAIIPYREAAILANELGLGINAGHDLDLNNLAFFKENIPGLLEVSIGHALISDALYLGLENAVQLYKRALE